MTTFTRQALHSPRRSLVKTVTWRLVAAIDTFAISLLITGSFAWAGSIVGIEALTKMVFYYLHERAWGHVLWGTQPQPVNGGD
jgi:uncharacterized membrane protein